MILTRNIIKISDIQDKILKSAWGEPSIEDATVEKITYLSDDLRISGFLAYPKLLDRKYPCVIWCRGGFGNAGALDNFYAKGILGQLASWGYVVFASQYRGNDGGEGKDEFGGSDLNDVLNLIPLADELDFTNKHIWGIEGWSRGGLMTYLALSKNHKFKAAITTGGISNIECNLSESNFMKKLVKFDHSLLENDFCNKRTVFNFLDKFSTSTPLLMMHGLNDKRVPPHHSIDLSYKFIELGIEHRLVLFENGDHFLKSHKQEVDQQRKNWFSKYLI